MLREHSKLLARIHMIMDIFWVVLAFVAAYHTKRSFVFFMGQGLSIEPNYYLVLLIAVVAAFFSFSAAGCYRPYRTQTLLQIYTRVIRAVAGVLFGTIILLYLLHEHNVSRMLLALFIIFLIFFLLLSKGVICYILRYYRSRSYNTRNLLIVGAGQRAERIIEAIRNHKGSGYRIIGCLTTDNDKKREEKKHLSGEIRLLGSVSTLPIILTEDIVDEIIFAADIDKIEGIDSLIRFAEHLGVNVHIVPDFQLEKIMYQPEVASISIQDFFGHPTLSLSTTPQRKNALIVKDIIDYSFAGIGVIFLFPIFLIIILLIKATSDGPAFFIQQRCGLYGRTFPLIKFRT
ncbi:sugar transferase, partial [Desulfobulbus sp. US4]|nr:sugar transferase [Desulfobulbus sp. US4]